MSPRDTEQRQSGIVSKALLKSNDITMTNGLDCRRVVMVRRSNMTAAEVELIGRKVY